MILKYFFAWFVMIILAVLNGGFREFIIKIYFGELAAHQISTIILIILITAYLWFLTRLWPIKSVKQAWIIGCIWFIMTEVFEFGMGRFLLNEPWDKLFYAYNLFVGQVWIFIPLWVLVGPIIFYRFIQNKSSAP
jgi:hypothetical protein